MIPDGQNMLRGTEFDQYDAKYLPAQDGRIFCRGGGSTNPGLSFCFSGHVSRNNHSMRAEAVLYGARYVSTHIVIHTLRSRSLTPVRALVIRGNTPGTDVIN